MNEVVDITCKAGAGHALQRKVKCFDLVCKRGGVQRSTHEKEERRAENLSHCMELDVPVVSYRELAVLLIMAKLTDMPGVLKESVQRSCQLKLLPQYCGSGFPVLHLLGPVSLASFLFSAGSPWDPWVAGHDPS